MTTDIFRRLSEEEISVEISTATRKGLICPQAGLPDYEAIEEVFNLSLDDITSPPSMLTEKLTEKIRGIRGGEDDPVGATGEHKRYGADVEP